MSQQIQNLGKLIKTARIKCRLTQKKLANRCYLTQDYIYKIEAGTIPSIATLATIFDAIGLEAKFEQWKTIIEKFKWDQL